MEQEHPIPQQISSYQFRLVGDMTLKQFFQIAGGALVSLVLYASGLPVYVKWPLIIFSFLFGVALAFFPLQDRPLSTWIVSFFKSIYSPTIYRWTKRDVKPSYFAQETTAMVVAPTPTEVAEAQPTPVNQLEKKEAEFLSKVTEHFKSPAPAPKSKPKTGAEEVLIPTKAFIYQENEIKPITSEKTKGVVIPIPAAPVIEKSEKPEQKEDKPQADKLRFGTFISPMTSQTPLSSTQATFSIDSTPPLPPTKPNIVVGQVTTDNNKILENAILEIQDSEGRPARAVKSNRLGHFMIVTPLVNGDYKIITEKEGFSFEPVSFVAKGEIIPSIAIKAK